MDKNERAALDAYRKERKERIAKQAKSNSKKSHGVGGNSKVIDKVVSIIISVVLVVAIVAGTLSYAGIPQRMIKAVSIDGTSYSMAELSCYYMQMFTNTLNTAYSYDQQYGEGYGKMLTGYDMTLSPADQSTTNEDEETVTWDEYFMDAAIESMSNIKRYYKLAVDAGIELDEHAEEEIEETINSFMANANDYSLNAILKKQFGDGVNEKLFRKILQEQQMVALYQEQRQEEYRNSYTDKDIDEVYAKDATAYDSVGFRWFTIDVASSSKTETTSGAEETSDAAATVLPEETKAQTFIDKVKSQSNYNEDTFKKVVLEYAEKEDLEQYKKDEATKLQKIDKETIKTNINEDAAKWLFEQKDGNYVRQAGDMKYFLNSDKTVVYIIYAIGTPFKDATKPVSVRHILVKYPETTTVNEAASGEATSETAEETTISAEIKSECYSEAESILNKYNSYIKENTSGAADEDYFVELVSEFSDDTGSASSGGLIENMKNDGSYVASFEDWAFAEGEFDSEKRDAGSTAVIETEYGYHVMYYVEAAEHPVWYESILTDLVDEAWEKEQTAFEEQTGEDAIERKWTANRVLKKCIKNIELYYVSQM